MSIVEFDGPPSWSLNASETGESKKMPVVRGGGANNVVKRQKNFTLSHTHGISCSSNGNT